MQGYYCKWGDLIAQTFYFRQTAAGAGGSGTYMIPIADSNCKYNTTIIPAMDTTAAVMYNGIPIGRAHMAERSGGNYDADMNVYVLNSTGVIMHGYRIENGSIGTPTYMRPIPWNPTYWGLGVADIFVGASWTAPLDSTV